MVVHQNHKTQVRRTVRSLSDFRAMAPQSPVPRSAGSRLPLQVAGCYLYPLTIN